MESGKSKLVAELMSLGYDKDIIEKAYSQCQVKDTNSLLEWIKDWQEKMAIEMSLQETKADEAGQGQADPKMDAKGQEGQKMAVEEQKAEQQSEEKPSGIPISDKVDQGMVKQLMEQGFSKNVAEKSLFLTQKFGSIPAALDWIEEHSYDPDFEEELKIVGEQKQLTPEEVALQAQKLKELARLKREQKKKEEEQYEIEKEKKRIQNAKVMGNTRQEIQEIQQKRALEELKKQKEQDRLEKQRMQEQLLRDKEERFGKKFDLSGKPLDQKKPEKTPIQLFEDSVNAVVIANPNGVFPDRARTALQTIRIYLENILKNPNEEKFKKITTTKPYFQSKVEIALGASSVLLKAGFVQNAEMLEFKSNVDANFFKQCLEILDNQIKLIY